MGRPAKIVRNTHLREDYVEILAAAKPVLKRARAAVEDGSLTQSWPDLTIEFADRLSGRGDTPAAFFERWRYHIDHQVAGEFAADPRSLIAKRRPVEPVPASPEASVIAYREGLRRRLEVSREHFVVTRPVASFADADARHRLRQALREKRIPPSLWFYEVAARALWRRRPPQRAADLVSPVSVAAWLTGRRWRLTPGTVRRQQSKRLR